MPSRNPYASEKSDLNGVARGRRLVTPTDGVPGVFPVVAKALEIVNRGPVWRTVAIRDALGIESTIQVPPNSKDYPPCMVVQVFATGTSVSVDLIIHAYQDGE